VGGDDNIVGKGGDNVLLTLGGIFSGSPKKIRHLAYAKSLVSIHTYADGSAWAISEEHFLAGKEDGTSSTRSRGELE
jgi:hypothetical protein